MKDKIYPGTKGRMSVYLFFMKETHDKVVFCQINFRGFTNNTR